MNDVTRWLAEVYFAGDGTALASPQMSSHWRLFSSRFAIGVAEDGAIETLEGYGFGDLHTGTLVTSLIGRLGVLSAHLLQPGRQRRRWILRRVRDILSRMRLPLTQDVFRQVCTAELLRDHVRETASLRIMLIGDGYGVLAALLKTIYPTARIVLVDLGATLLFQSVYLDRALPEAIHRAITSLKAADGWAFDFLYCPAECLDSIPAGDLDLAVNIASFQEMTPNSVAQYFDFLRQRKTALFYCCNRERKELPGGEVQEFQKYPWRASDEHLISGPCPWHQWHLAFGGHARHVRLLGLPLPFVRRYDGLHLHRLARLDGEARKYV